MGPLAASPFPELAHNMFAQCSDVRMHARTPQQNTHPCRQVSEFSVKLAAVLGLKGDTKGQLRALDEVVR